MKTEHTPGPWHIGMRPGPMVYGQLGEQVADCRGLDESGFNARLIAAAPELLRLLKETMSYLDAAAYQGNEEQFELYGECQKIIAETVDESPFANASGNARLIAAAPDLLAACKNALEDSDDFRAMEMLKAAIEKAEG